MAITNHKRYSLILKLDIADYFSSISIELIKRAITCTDVDKLCALLEVIGSRGLPVGGNASRIISELIGGYIDKWLIGNKIYFHRYVDDYVIFFENEQEPLVLLSGFEAHLSQLGFRLNHTKTKAYPIDLRYMFLFPVLELQDLIVGNEYKKY